MAHRRSLTDRIARDGVIFAGAGHRARLETGALAEPPISEKRWQTQVLALAKACGWGAYHTHDSRNSAPGFPDLVLVRRPRVVFAELKSQRGKLTAEQRAWIEELRACGQSVFVWRPDDWHEVERVLR